MKSKTPPRLSKSRILSGLQCERRLWLESWRRDLLDIDATQQRRFDIGNELGELARELYGPGVLVGHVDNVPAALAETASLLSQRKVPPVIFEAAFSHDGVVVRADVMRRVRGGWDLIEVKASTSVKDYYLNDCAVQAYVLEGSGISLKGIRLAHVDSSFVYTKAGDYRGLLVEEDVEASARERMAEVPGWIRTFRRMLGREEPAIATGKHCHEPFECSFFDHCKGQEPADAEYPLWILPHRGKLADALAEEGYRDLRDVPLQRLEKPLHQRVHQATTSGHPFLDKAVRAICCKLHYPRYFLDFETIDFAVPNWVGTRPYQQVPFQWSCHVQRRDGSLDASGFLDLSGQSPVRPFAKSLLKTLGKRGPILVYNQAFEASRVKELAAMLPDIGQHLLALIDRMVDLLPIARDHYYHPAMKGSWSIKAVLPTIAPELTYDSLEEVGDGGEAQQAYLEAIAPQTTVERRGILEQALLRYCGLDTLALVRLMTVFSQA